MDDPTAPEPKPDWTDSDRRTQEFYASLDSDDARRQQRRMAVGDGLSIGPGTIEQTSAGGGGSDGGSSGGAALRPAVVFANGVLATASVMMTEPVQL